MYPFSGKSLTICTMFFFDFITIEKTFSNFESDLLTEIMILLRIKIFSFFCLGTNSNLNKETTNFNFLFSKIASSVTLNNSHTEGRKITGL